MTITTSIRSFESAASHEPLKELAGKRIKDITFIPYQRVEITLDDGQRLVLREVQQDGDIEVCLYR